MPKSIGVIVPAATDLNRGDQALVLEAARFVTDSGLADQIYVIDPGYSDGVAQVEQIEAEGCIPLASLTKDPRRGKTNQSDKVAERKSSTLRLAFYAVFDFLAGTWLLMTARWPRLARLFLNADQRRTYDVIRQASVVVVKGGGFLHAHGELRAPYYIWFQLFYLRLAQRLGKYNAILPNSFGPFVGWTVAGQIRRVLSKCDFIAARESISAKALTDTISRPVPVYPDMGYFLHEADHGEARAVCVDAGVPLGTQTCVGITVRPWRFPGLDDPKGRYERYIDSLASLVQHVREQGACPVLITQVLGPSAHENDNLAIQDLQQRLADQPAPHIDIAGTCREVKAIYGCMDFVVGTRFHSVIFAQGCGVASMAITYGGNKGTGIMGDLRLSDYEIPIEQVTADGVCAAFDQLVGNAENVRERLAQWRQEAAHQRDTMLDEVAGRSENEIKVAA